MQYKNLLYMKVVEWYVDACNTYKFIQEMLSVCISGAKAPHSVKLFGGGKV